MNYRKTFVAFLFALVLVAPTLASAATFTRNLGQGTTGTDVTQLQQFLTSEGVYAGPVTAYYGAGTAKAVRAFQQKEGITPSGYFGAITRLDANKIVTARTIDTTPVTPPETTTHYTNVDGISVQSPTYSTSGIPAGATAECRDGTYSFSLHHQGSCSHHGGVNSWLR